jgi:restriction endonuclease S subunit
MSTIDQLLAKHCPNGVEYFALSEVCSTFSGGFIKKTKQDATFTYPVYNGGAEPTGMYSDFNSEANSIAISARGSIGFVNWVEQKFWAGNSCHVVLSKSKDLENRYVYFYLKHHEFDLYALRNVGSIPALNLGPLLKFRIPIPHIDVQLEIIRILEEFTALEKELEKELIARRKQLQFYRNQLLSFKELE